MAKRSAGIVLYRRVDSTVEIFLVHPGGPFWANKDAGSWSIPKGEYAEGEDPLAAARREFEEETGTPIVGEFHQLTAAKQKSGKTISAWAVEGTCDATAIRSNTFAMEWPPKSGRQAEFPEVDRAAWFTPSEAMQKLVGGQVTFVEQLCDHLGIERAKVEVTSSDPAPEPDQQSFF